MSVRGNTQMRTISIGRKIGCLVLVLLLATIGIPFTLEKQNTTNGSISPTEANNTAMPSNTTTPGIPEIPVETNDTSKTNNPPVKDNATQPIQQNHVNGTGTIKFLHFEGGFYGIVSDDGKRYDPTALDQEFQIDSLRVKFEVEPLHGMATIHMWGTPVSIIHIEKLNP
jgi:hypothetical protein